MNGNGTALAFGLNANARSQSCGRAYLPGKEIDGMFVSFSRRQCWVKFAADTDGSKSFAEVRPVRAIPAHNGIETPDAFGEPLGCSNTVEPDHINTGRCQRVNGRGESNKRNDGGGHPDLGVTVGGQVLQRWQR